MFYDEVTVRFEAGDGGDGCFSLHRAKFEPKGGPDGGDGGDGGDVRIVADPNVADLTDYYYKRNWRARNGEPGRGSDQHGKSGETLVLHVPVGTVVADAETGETVAEALDPGRPTRLLAGGRGGTGNTAFKSPANQTPRQYTPGTPGDKGDFRLIVKTMADVGLIGFPNAGKSTLLATLTNARPKTAAYPFTTIQPMPGVVEMGEGRDYERFTIADVPGLIEGASENRGLGHRFLKHVERCSALLLVIDAEGTDGREPLEDLRVLRRELERYSEWLSAKPGLIAANKMDEPRAAENLRALRREAEAPVHPISCASEEGVEALKRALAEAVRSAPGGGEQASAVDGARHA